LSIALVEQVAAAEAAAAAAQAAATAHEAQSKVSLVNRLCSACSDGH
jgi:hypothetical protein